MEVFLDFYGVGVSIDAPEIFCRWIEHDFYCFIAEKTINPFFCFTIFEKNPVEIPKGFASTFSCAEYIVFDSGNRRYVDYFGKVVAVYDLKKHSIDFFSKDLELSFQKFYHAILTVVGKELDLRGFHRIHCAGVSENKEALILLSNAGMGKTTLVEKILLRKNLKILSDEIVLFRNLDAFPFFLRLGIRKNSFDLKIEKIFFREYSLPDGSRKILVSGKFFEKQVSGKSRIYAIALMQRVSGSECGFSKTGKISVFWNLFKKSVFGSELMQEHAFFCFPGINDSFARLRIYLSRFFSIIAILIFSKSFVFSAGTNVNENAVEVENFFRK